MEEREWRTLLLGLWIVEFSFGYNIWFQKIICSVLLCTTGECNWCKHHGTRVAPRLMLCLVTWFNLFLKVFCWKYIKLERIFRQPGNIKIVKREKHTFVSLLLVRLFSFHGEETKAQETRREKEKKAVCFFSLSLAYTTLGLVKYKREYGRKKEKETMTCLGGT